MYTFHKTSRNKVLRNEALLHRDTPKYSQSKTGNKSKKYLTPSQKLTLQKKGKKKVFPAQTFFGQLRRRSPPDPGAL